MLDTTDESETDQVSTIYQLVTHTMRLTEDELYNRALYWIIRQRAGQGGWPPACAAKVSGWLVVNLVAGTFGKNVRNVAADLIDRYEATLG